MNHKLSIDGTELPHDIEKGECRSTALSKATIVWEPQAHCQVFEVFELIRFNAFMVKYQERKWIETNSDWAIVQVYVRKNTFILIKTNSQIATRFEVYRQTKFRCRTNKPLHSTEYEDIHIIYGHEFDMKTEKPMTKMKIYLSTKNPKKLKNNR